MQLKLIKFIKLKGDSMWPPYYVDGPRGHEAAP